MKYYNEQGLKEFSSAIDERMSLALVFRPSAEIAHKIAVQLDQMKNIDHVMEPVSFGTMRVDSLELVFHNWYDSKKTVLAKFPLQ